MKLVIIIFGVAIFLTGIFIIIKPETLFGILKNNIEKPLLHILAVVVRLLIGAILIVQAGESRFPLVIEIIGWLAVAAAVVFVLIGRHRFQRLMKWALSFTEPLGRVGGIVATAFGAFLVHAFI